MAVRKYFLFELPSCWHQPDPEPRNVHRFWPLKQVFYVFSSIYQREYKFIPISKLFAFFPLDSLLFKLDSVRLSNCKNFPGKRVRGNVFGKFELLNCCFLNYLLIMKTMENNINFFSRFHKFLLCVKPNGINEFVCQKMFFSIESFYLVTSF